ncbi:pyridoxal phosphate-dependent aminotransferase [Enterococcus alishanensis]|uniref:Pyridoxal phosphate-dependent aminotransferase n=1 Tax=Enterococcus alishanensis TaxID=1303817 RepID=A0ABS6T927_9ENTE|nr:pyridoxal phosphate-dependent aminotransferase [Enterococcus alishanensis]MBV7389401.1 pyridoxal phosphate-dependent aminotransferase [Enterococcus alishanensis]
MPFSSILKSLPDQFFAQLVAKVNQKIAAGYDVINLGQGNPDLPTPRYIIEALQQAVAEPDNHKYSQFRGNHIYKQACADFYQKNYGVTLDPETEIAVLGGSKIGLVELPLTVMEPGDTLLLPDPGYPDYLSGTELARAKKELLPLKPENGYLPDYSQVDEKILAAAKLLYLNYPNNPTGAQATPEFFAETVKVAKENDFQVVHDFAYGALGDGITPPISFMTTEGAKDVGIEFYTLSKTFNMAGWRVAFAVGNKELIAAINLLQDHLFVGIFPALQVAGATALQGDGKDIAALVETYRKRRQTFIQAAEKIGWQAYPSSGAFYCWMPVAEGYTSEAFADLLLEKASVAVAAGNGFGEQGEGYVRVGLTIEEPRLIEAVERIAALELFNS